MYGWYSEKMAHYMRHPHYEARASYPLIYSTPDGREVKVTDVTREKKQYVKWADTIYVGEVSKFLREDRS